MPANITGLFCLERSRDIFVGGHFFIFFYFGEKSVKQANFDLSPKYHMEGQHQSPFQLLSVNIRAVLSDVINQLESTEYSGTSI